MERNVERKAYTPSVYTSQNETEAALAWSSILPGHGVVAIKPEYAKERALPPTMALPGDDNTLVYAIEAYHAMHCTVSNLGLFYVVPLMMLYSAYFEFTTWLSTMEIHGIGLHNTTCMVQYRKLAASNLGLQSNSYRIDSRRATLGFLRHMHPTERVDSVSNSAPDQQICKYL